MKNQHENMDPFIEEIEGITGKGTANTWGSDIHIDYGPNRSPSEKHFLALSDLGYRCIINVRESRIVVVIKETTIYSK